MASIGWHNVALVAVALTGCNTIFGLDEPAIGPGKLDANLLDTFLVDGDISDVPDVLPSGFDEDNDGIDDAIDNCPHIANPGQESVEVAANRVGFACDPTPNELGDRLVTFAGFHGGLPPGWLTTGNAWSFANDDISWLGGGSGPGFVGPSWTNTGPEASRKITVVGAMTLAAVNDTVEQRFGVWVDYESTTGYGYLCGMWRPITGPVKYILYLVSGSGFPLSSSDTGNALSLGRYDLTLAYMPDPSAMHEDCTIDHSFPIHYDNNNNTFMTGQAGAHVLGASVAVHYLVVYSSPVTP